MSHCIKMQCFLWFSALLRYNFLALPPCSAADAMQHANWKLLNDEICGSSIADRIIGGKNASLGAYPWIARIGYTRDSDTKENHMKYLCGGALINELYVITAAHCVSELPKRFKVAGIRLGDHNAETDPDCEKGYCAEPVQDFKPASIIVHKDYNTPAFKNDIAMVRLDRRARYTDFVLPICMPKDHPITRNHVGEVAEVAGWGVYDTSVSEMSTILQTVDLPIVRLERCVRAFGRFADVDERQICAGGAFGQDSCGGDSGGPLMKVEDLDGPPRYFLLGVVSFGTELCGKSTRPGVYTKVAFYTNWILDNVSP